jgi:hypothetical protein
METTILSLMIVGLMAVFTVDTFEKRRNYLKNGK